jgi:sugar phosphate isomerase/epimerase
MLKLATKFTPQPLAFETAHRAGYRHAELWLGPAILADWQNVAAQANHYPLRCALHFPNRLDLSPETLEHATRLFRALDCRCMVIHQPMFDRFHETLARLEPDMRLGVENHRLSPEAFDQWADRNTGLTLDVEHLWKFTLRDAPLPELRAAVRRFLERWADKLRHVHLPGYLPGLPEHRPMYCSREMVCAVLTLLAEFRFEGLIVSEVNPEYQNLNDLRMDALLFDTWREHCNPLSGRTQE